MRININSIGVVIIFSIIFLLLLILQFLHRVPENHYTISDQTQEIILEDYPELKEVSFMYSTDLYIEYTEPINLELEKINFRFNDEVIGTADSLEEGRFYIDIYIKDLKTNETFIIKRDNISIYYESAGIKLYLPSI